MYLYCALLCLLFGLSYGATTPSKFDPASYTGGSYTFDALDFTVYWRADQSANEIYLGLKAKTTGWLAFGIAEITSGSMPGADIIQGYHDAKTNKGYVTDRHSHARVTPDIDDCQQVTLIHSEETSDGYTILEVKRPINTTDPQDRSIVDGPNRVIASFSDSNSDEFVYHGVNRKTGAIAFWGQALYSGKAVANEQTMDLRMSNFKVPDATTVYACQAFPMPQDNDYMITQIDPIVNPANIGHVHHFLAHICLNETAGAKRSIVDTYARGPGVCNTPLGNFKAGCVAIMSAWAAGGGSVFTPAEAGFAMGIKASSIKWIVLEVHYNNPTGVAGYTDDSGIKIHYSSTLRPYEAGVITLGDPFTQFSPIPANSVKEYEAECLDTCTNAFSDDIKVFHSFPHMHQVGSKIWTTQWRDGKQIDEYGRIEFWTFDHQLTQEMNKTIKRGDRLNTHCVFDTTGLANATTFGIASTQEMCMHFISYYPRLFGPTGLVYSFCGAYTRANSSICDNIYAINNPQNIDPVGGAVTRFGQPYTGTCPVAANNDNSSSSSSLAISFSVLFALVSFLCL